MNERLIPLGTIEIFEVDDWGRKKLLVAQPNLIVNVGLDALAQALVSQNLDGQYAGGANVQPRYTAFGNPAYPATAPAAGNTALQALYNPSAANTSIKAFTSITHQSTGVTKLITLYGVGEANGASPDFSEAGIYAGGALAGDPPSISSFILISRVALGATVAKSGAASLQIEWTYTLSNAP